MHIWNCRGDVVQRLQSYPNQTTFLILTTFLQHVNQIAKPSGAHLLPRWIRYFEKYGCQDAFALMRNDLIAGFTTLVKVHFDFLPEILETTACASVHSLQEVMGFH